MRVAARAKAPKLTPEQRLLCEQLRPVAAPLGLRVVPEHRFHPSRRWRIDVALIEIEDGVSRWNPGWAIEIDGGAWLPKSRHTSGRGFTADLEKMNALTELGWRILRFTPQQVRNGEALAQIRRCL